MAKTRKVKLVQRNRAVNGDRCQHVEWSMSVPFAMSTRGVLIHRVRYAGSIIFDGEHSHDWVTYWCGNGTTSPAWMENPLENRLVCNRCECLAVSNGEPTTDALAGEHVHKGVLIAHRTCCQPSN